MSLDKTRDDFVKGKLAKPDYIEKMYCDNHAHLFDYAKYIHKTDINKIEISSEGVVFYTKMFGIKMLCLEDDFRLAPIEILNFLKYEPDETAMMLRLMPEAATIFDVGANAGWYSVLFAKNDSGANVYSYEPIPKTYDLLKKNVVLNSLQNIEIFNCGLSDNEGELVFYYHPEGSGNASSVNVAERSDIRTVSAAVKTLDAVRNERGLSVDFIKCDVEGAELMVYQGGKETIANDKPIIFSEMLRKWASKFGYHPNQIIDYLSGFGYICCVVDGDRLSVFQSMDDSTAETNFFFLHETKHKDELDKLLV